MNLYNKTRVNLKEGDRAFNFSATTYNSSQNVTIQKGCTAVMFTNTGADVATVNGMILYPGTVGTILGDSRSIAAHKNDILQGQLKLAFQTVTGPAMEIVQVYYLDYE